MYSPSSVLSNYYNINVGEIDEHVRFAIEAQIRLLSGMWVAAGLFVVFLAITFESNTHVLRLVFLGLSLGALGELLTAYTLASDIQPALIKALLQLGICIGMESWRRYIVRRI